MDSDNLDIDPNGNIMEIKYIKAENLSTTLLINIFSKFRRHGVKTVQKNKESGSRVIDGKRFLESNASSNSRNLNLT